MKSKIILAMLMLCTLLSCKKDNDSPSVTTDPVEGEWYFRLSDANGVNGNANHFGTRAPISGQLGRGNFTISPSFKTLYQVTKVADGKYSISSNAYTGGQFLTYQTFVTEGYAYLPFSNNGYNTTDNELFTFEKITGTTDTYLIKSVSNPLIALSGSSKTVNGATSIQPNFVVAGASFTYQKWKLEK